MAFVYSNLNQERMQRENDALDFTAYDDGATNTAKFFYRMRMMSDSNKIEEEVQSLPLTSPESATYGKSELRAVVEARQFVDRQDMLYELEVGHVSQKSAHRGADKAQAKIDAYQRAINEELHRRHEVLDDQTEMFDYILDVQHFFIELSDPCAYEMIQGGMTIDEAVTRSVAKNAVDCRRQRENEDAEPGEKKMRLS